MKPLLMTLMLCGMMLGALPVQVEADVVDSAGQVLTWPESIAREYLHPGSVRRCLAGLRSRMPPPIIDTSNLTLEDARINTYLHLTIPLKEPQQGIERVHWAADSLSEAQNVLSMLHEGKLRGVRVVPIRAEALPVFYWLYGDRDPRTKEALKNCQVERILERFRCRNCVIAELVGVRP